MGRVTAIARVLVVCSIVLALAGSTPVACWCDPAEHDGQPLHPLFAHSHGAVPAADAAMVAEPEQPIASWTSTTATGVSAWSGGIQTLPSVVLAAVLPVIGERIALDIIRPLEHLDAPVFPPPR